MRYRLIHPAVTRARYAMRGEWTSYPPPLLCLRQGAVVEMEGRHRRCCSLAVVEAGAVLERVEFGLQVESLK
jgi:hypothetical protein